MDIKKEKYKIFLKVLISMLCIVGLIILIGIRLNACFPKRTYEEMFKNNWDINLPENMEEIFYGSDVIWGEGVTYVVFKLEEEPSDFIEDFSKERNEEFLIAVNDKINYATKTSSEKFEIPLNFLPDWGIEYYWKHAGNGYWEEYGFYQNNLYMIYFPDTLRLIICEIFI